MTARGVRSRVRIPPSVVRCARPCEAAAGVPRKRSAAIIRRSRRGGGPHAAKPWTGAQPVAIAPAPRATGSTSGTVSTGKKKAAGFSGFVLCNGGEGGIRTHGTLARTPDFESGTFDHSATSPRVEGAEAYDQTVRRTSPRRQRPRTAWRTHARSRSVRIDRSPAYCNAGTTPQFPVRALASVVGRGHHRCLFGTDLGPPALSGAPAPDARPSIGGPFQPFQESTFA